MSGATSDGTCFVCFTPTDTVIGSRGKAEFHIAFALVLGAGERDAEPMVTNADGTVPGGVYPVTWRVCRSCVAACPAGFPAPVLALPGVTVPTIGTAS